jgi:hypothetical protein
MVHGFLFWYKKAVMPKKKVIAARNLKIWTRFTTKIKEKQMKIRIIYRDKFCASLKSRMVCVCVFVCVCECVWVCACEHARTYA